MAKIETEGARASPVDPAVKAAARATYAAFIGIGIAFSSWATRIPQVRDHLGLNPAELGLVLLFIAGGSVISLPLSGSLIHRTSSQFTVRVMSVLLSAALLAIAVGYLANVWCLAAALCVFGFAIGAWDVAMNVQGADVERALGRDIMSRFHAGFSIGSVVGALIAAGMIALEVNVTIHLIAVAVVIALTIPRMVKAFLPDDHRDPGAVETKRPAIESWKEPRTLLIGLFVLAFAFTEGTATDWTSVALIDGYGASEFVGSLGFAAFLAAMTAARWVGPTLLERYGRVRTVRCLSAVSLVGVLIFVFAPNTGVAIVGAVLWGLGASLGFPVGMSAGADDPKLAAGRVSVIASVGYCAFLAGPPLVGFLGNEFTILPALLSVGLLLAMAVGLAGVLEPLKPEPVDEPQTG